MELTIEQIDKISLYQKQYKENVEEYSAYDSEKICSFNVYASVKEEDKNITIVLATITGISDYYQPFSQVNNIMVEPDGNSFNLTDIYNRNEVLLYISNLKKLDKWEN